MPRASQAGFVSHQDSDNRLLQVVRTLWAELCLLVQAYSPVLQQLHVSANMCCQVCLISPVTAVCPLPLVQWAPQVLPPILP